MQTQAEIYAPHDAAAGSSTQIINENRPAISSFAKDGLAQVRPTLAEPRSLIRDLREISAHLADPAGPLLDRDAFNEFEPK